MTINVTELGGYRLHPENGHAIPMADLFGGAAFRIAYHDAMSRIDIDQKPLLGNPAEIAATVNFAIFFAAKVPGDQFGERFDKIQSRLPEIAETLIDPDRVEAVLDEQPADAAEFLITTASHDHPESIIEAVTDPARTISQEDALEFRTQILALTDEPIENSKPSEEQKDKTYSPYEVAEQIFAEIEKIPDGISLRDLARIDRNLANAVERLDIKLDKQGKSNHPVVSRHQIIDAKLSLAGNNKALKKALKIIMGGGE